MRTGMHALLALLGLSAPSQSPAPAPPPAIERVEGRVVDLLGEPLVAAMVVVTPWRDPDTVLARGATDGEGRFVFGSVPIRDAWGVRASSPHCASASLWAVPGRGPFTVRLPESVRVAGHLRDRGGKPVAGVVVNATLAYARELAGACDRAVTDDDGRFELKNVPLGFVCFAAVIPDVGLGLSWRHVRGEDVVDIGPPAGKSMDTVIEIEGLPIDGPPPGAAVAIRSRNRLCSQLPPPWNRVPMDRSGRIEIRQMPESWFEVTPEIPGFVCQPLASDLRPDNRQLRFVALRADDARLLWQGTLTDDLGKPCAQCDLEVRGKNAGPRATTRTDADGRWRLSLPVPVGQEVVVRLLPGDLVLDVDSPMARLDWRAASEFRGQFAPNAPLALRAQRAAQVAGTVVLADGAPAVGVVVQLEQFERDRLPKWSWGASATTDARGNYVFRGVHATSRPVRCRVQSGEGVGTTAEFALDLPGMRVEPPPLQLSSTAVVEGVVRDAAGKPVPGLRVWLRELEGATNVYRGSIFETYTDHQGRCRWSGLASGRVVLQMVLDQESPAANAGPPIEVEAGRVSQVTLTW